jgi:uncharacterized glyoxalase superfamily protein PhnB
MADVGPGAFTPAVFYRDPLAALAWLEAAFGFETSLVVTGPDGSVGHAAMTFQGSGFDIGGEWASPELIGPAALKSPASLGGVGTQFVRVSLEGDLDAHCARARAAGARITQAPANEFYGARTYRALDLEGHVWTFQQTLEDVSLAEMERRSGLSIREKL